jgi:hypothetical protein
MVRPWTGFRHAGKKYIKQCHPDLHGHNPEIQQTANTLTRLLTEAYERIKKAWEAHQG